MNQKIQLKIPKMSLIEEKIVLEFHFSGNPFFAFTSFGVHLVFRTLIRYF